MRVIEKRCAAVGAARCADSDALKIDISRRGLNLKTHLRHVIITVSVEVLPTVITQEERLTIAQSLLREHYRSRFGNARLYHEMQIAALVHEILLCRHVKNGSHHAHALGDGKRCLTVEREVKELTSDISAGADDEAVGAT